MLAPCVCHENKRCCNGLMVPWAAALVSLPSPSCAGRTSGAALLWMKCHVGLIQAAHLSTEHFPIFCLPHVANRMTVQMNGLSHSLCYSEQHLISGKAQPTRRTSCLPDTNSAQRPQLGAHHRSSCSLWAELLPVDEAAQARRVPRCRWALCTASCCNL